MKRLIILNVIVYLSLYLLPSHNVNSKTIEIEQETIAIVQEEVIREEISSRSLEEPRTPVEEVVYATTYSEELVNYIKQPNVEGFKGTAYMCAEDSDNSNAYTIGYGHHGKNVKAGETITEEAADRLLRADLNGACQIVLKHCEYLGGLTQGELDALVDFTFNGGAGMLQQLTAHKTRNKEEIAEHITAYTNHGLRGLVSRRNEELKMFKGEI